MELARWYSGYEHWLLIQRTQVQTLEPKWLITTTYYHSLKGALWEKLEVGSSGRYDKYMHDILKEYICMHACIHNAYLDTNIQRRIIGESRCSLVFATARSNNIWYVFGGWPVGSHGSTYKLILEFLIQYNYVFMIGC